MYNTGGIQRGSRKKLVCRHKKCREFVDALAAQNLAEEPLVEGQPQKRGALVVVGTGIGAQFYLSPDARHFIAKSDAVFYLVTDAIAEKAVRDLNPKAQSLAPLYAEGKLRLRTY